jgi:hypothetical protein
MQTVTSSLDLDVKDLHLRLTKEFDNVGQLLASFDEVYADPRISQVLRTFVSATVDLEVRQADRENSLVRQVCSAVFLCHGKPI